MVLPSLPPAPSGLVLFSPAQWAWVSQVLGIIYQGVDAQLEAFGPLTAATEDLVATVAELQQALDANTTATSAAASAIQTEIQQLKDALDALSTSTPPSQAQLDQLNAATAKLETATAALGADDPSTPTT